MSAMFPRMDEFMEMAGYSEKDKHVIIATILIMIPVTLVVLAWLAFHFYTILFKQGRYVVLPLTTFYVLAIILVVAHMYTYFMFGEILLE